MTRDGAVWGNERRPGRSACECRHKKHDGRNCERIGSMRDGWFLCGPCQHHDAYQCGICGSFLRRGATECPRCHSEFVS